jgi:hypothetical protein
MWTRLGTVALCLAGVTAHAQPANDSMPRLDSCIQAAGLAEAICSKIPGDPMQRADCFAKARAAQLECLDRVLSEAPGATAPPGRSSKTALPEPPAETTPPQASPERPASNATGRTGQPDVAVGSAADEAAKPSDAAPKPAPASGPPAEAAASTGAIQSSETGLAGQPDVSVGSKAADEAARLSDAAPKPAPASVPPPETAAPTGAIQSSETGRTGQPDVSVGSNAADDAPKLSDAAPKPAPASVPAPEAEVPTGAIQSTSSELKIDKPAVETNWIVSETTSPVDYSPLVTAVVRSASNTTDGPNTLTVRCRGRHTELSIRRNETWGARPGNELLVDHQINDRPVVRQPWILSTDGKAATYKNDPVEFLRSMPEGATLKVAVAEKSNVHLAATFELAGLSVIRQKVGTACKWAPLTAKTSSEKP